MNYLISIDDTDDVTKEVSTGGIAEIISDVLESKGARLYDGISRHQLLLSEDITYTSHNSSMCIEFESDDLQPMQILDMCEKILKENMSPLSNPGVAVCCKNQVESPNRLIGFGFDAKSKVMNKTQAYALSASIGGVWLKELGGSGLGVIGALAGIGLRMSRSDGSLRGKLCKELDGKIVTADEICKSCGIDFVITSDGFMLAEDDLIIVDKFVKLMFFNGHKCCMVKRERNGIYSTINQHKDREHFINNTDVAVCEFYENDNDEEEFVYITGVRSCCNCLYRRWTNDGFICMYQEA